MGICDNKVPYQCHSSHFTLIETLLPIIKCDVSEKYTKGRGQRTPDFLNFETKSILSDQSGASLISVINNVTDFSYFSLKMLMRSPII